LGRAFRQQQSPSPVQAVPSPTTTLQHANGRDKQSILDDELFIDPVKGIYQVMNNSPVLARGFKNFSMDHLALQIQN
jgi:hypothetical protein